MERCDRQQESGVLLDAIGKDVTRVGERAKELCLAIERSTVHAQLVPWAARPTSAPAGIRSFCPFAWGALRACLLHELALRGVPTLTQDKVSIKYKDITFTETLRFDVLADGCLLAEIKAVEDVLPVHKAQL